MQKRKVKKRQVTKGKKTTSKQKSVVGKKSYVKRSVTWLDKKLDYRYIYLMHLKRTNQYKIGISFYPISRLETIDDIVKGKVVILKQVRTIFAEKKEHWIHAVFHRQNFVKKNAGAGKTEWFRLNPLQVQYAKILMWWVTVKYPIIYATIIIIYLLSYFIE